MINPLAAYLIQSLEAEKRMIDFVDAWLKAHPDAVKIAPGVWQCPNGEALEL